MSHLLHHPFRIGDVPSSDVSIFMTVVLSGCFVVFLVDLFIGSLVTWFPVATSFPLGSSFIGLLIWTFAIRDSDSFLSDGSAFLRRLFFDPFEITGCSSSIGVLDALVLETFVVVFLSTLSSSSLGCSFSLFLRLVSNVCILWSWSYGCNGGHIFVWKLRGAIILISPSWPV